MPERSDQLYRRCQRLWQRIDSIKRMRDYAQRDGSATPELLREWHVELTRLQAEVKPLGRRAYFTRLREEGK